MGKKDEFPFFPADWAVHLTDTDYLNFLIHHIRTAKKSIHGVMFIIGVNGPKGPANVKKLLDELLYARWRGLDVRLIIGSSENFVINVANTTSFRYLNKKGLPMKFYKCEGDVSVHSKYIIFDSGLMVLGSHNWTENALSRNKEDSIAVFSKDGTLKLEKEFEKVWKSGLEERP